MQLQSVPGEPPQPADVAAARLAEQGIFVVSGPLTDEVAALVAARLLAHDPALRPPIIHLTNASGSVAAALMLHDLLGSIPPPVTIVAGGTLDTAGAILLVAGSAGRRTLLRSARIHLTRIVAAPSTGALDVEQAAAEVAHLRRAAEDALGLSVERPRVLDAEQAVAEGLADAIR